MGGNGKARKRGEIGVDNYSETWLRQGFPWVYKKEVTSGQPRPGATVVLRGLRGDLLGRGLADEGWIAVRVFRRDDGPIDRALIHARLDQAAALRDELIDAETTGYRLVNGENDDLPGLRIDWWGHYAVLVLDSPAVAPILEHVLSWLEAHRKPRGVYLCYRPDHRDERDFSRVSPEPGLLAGGRPAGDIRITERGLAFRVRPWDGPDVGLYSDMRDVRAWLEPHWGGRSVLNTFAYTGAFSVSAAFNGASEVVTVDLAVPAVDRAEENFRANELDPANYEFLAEDTFKALDRFRRTGRTFDRIILDPPSFSRSDVGVWSAKRDWPRLVSAACRVLSPGGWLIVASNQGEVSPREYQGFLLNGFKKAGRRAQELNRFGQGPDMPAAGWFPEGRYLKVGIWRVL